MSPLSEYYIGYVAIQAELIAEAAFLAMILIFFLEFFDWVDRK